MNLQELNQSGKKLWVFLMTGFILFISAFAAWAVAASVKKARANFAQRRGLLDEALRTRLHSLRYGRFGTWKYFIGRPRLLNTAVRKGLLLGILTGGLYDPKGILYFRALVKRRAKIVPSSWAPGRFKQEMKYFLGVNRLPEDESYEQVWRLRGESTSEVCLVLEVEKEQIIS